MCGINGFNFPDKELILKMKQFTSKRGPDAEGLYIDDNVTIGHSKKAILSNREKEILHLIANGKTSKEIASSLFIAKTTVDTHRKNMIRKLKLSTGNELVKYAIDKKYQF